MWKQSKVLGDVSDSTTVRPDEDAFGRIIQNVFLKLNESGIGQPQPSDNIEQRSLARSRGAKNYRNATAEIRFHFESKIGQSQPEIV